MHRNLRGLVFILSGVMAFCAQQAWGGERYAPGRVIVKFKADGRAPSGLRNRLHARTLKTLPRIRAEVWAISGSVEEAVARHRHDPDIEYIEPDYRVNAYLNLPNDPHFPEQWALYNTGQTGGSMRADIHAGEAWDVTQGASNVIIAVLDTGIDYTHPDLGGGFGPSYKVVGGYDFYNHDADPMDDHGHGTHCAGLIAAEANNALGVAGVSPACKLLAVKFLDANANGDISTAVQGMDYAVSHGAKIISNSWGGLEYSQAMQDAIDNAYAAGVLVIAAAGNNKSSAVNYPSCYNHVLAVGATDYNDHPATYTNFGDWVALSAPGGAADELCDLSHPSCARYPKPVSLLSTMSSGTFWNQWGVRCGGYDESGIKYMPASGTSMAAPLVAGTAGLLLAQNPALTPAMLHHFLVASGDPIPELTGKSLSGKRLNAAQALALANSGDAWAAPEGLADFGVVLESATATQTVTGYNTTASPVQITFSFDRPEFTASAGSLNLAAGGSGTCQIFFQSPAQGDFSGTLTCHLSTPVPKDQTIRLSGRSLSGMFALTSNDFNAGGERWYTCADWGDYDNDGQLDLVIAGSNNSGNPKIKIFHNNGNGTFTDLNADLPSWQAAFCRWGDYDGDGYLDLAVCGQDMGTFEAFTRIYHNDGNGHFTDIHAGLAGILDGGLAWGDYDNDGDLDLVLSGRVSGDTHLSKLYRNDQGVFTDSLVALPNAVYGSVAWGDFDHDGRLDLLFTGSQLLQTDTLRVYRNEGNGAFSLYPVNFTGIYDYRMGAVWGDVDNDGNLEILLHRDIDGQATHKIQIYRNNGGSFSQVVELDALPWGNVAWGDYDNDGRLDALVAGVGNAYLYHNEGGLVFTRIYLNTSTFQMGGVAWGDYDRDGRLDAALTGLTLRNGNVATVGMAKLYRNTLAVPAALPTSPTGLAAAVSQASRSVVLSWLPSYGSTTPSAALTYNLRLGTSSLSGNVAPPMSLGCGLRKIARPGNAGPNTHWTFKNLKPGTYYWSVQAVDHAYAGSPFSAEQTFTVLDLSTLTPTATVTATPAVETPTPTSTPTRTGLKLTGRELKIFPQPARNEVWLAFHALSDGTARCSLYNSNGERILSAEAEAYGRDEANILRLSLHGVPAGIYFYHLQFESADERKAWKGKIAVVR